MRYNENFKKMFQTNVQKDIKRDTQRGPHAIRGRGDDIFHVSLVPSPQTDPFKSFWQTII